LLTLLLAAMLAGAGSCAGGEPLGPIAPDLASASPVDLEGHPVDPFAQSRDHVLVLAFVRIDCPISNRYSPTLRKLCDEFARQGTSFYLVYPEPTATPERIREHQREFDLGMPAIRDPDHVLVKRAGARITPEAAVFNREGELVYRGRIDNRHVDFGRTRAAPTTHDLRDAIDSTLSNQIVSVPETEAVGCFIADLE
jgi:hypothetical protein